MVSQEDVAFHSAPTMMWARASRHAGRTALSVGGATAIPVPLMWNPTTNRPCLLVSYWNSNRRGNQRGRYVLCDAVLEGDESLIPKVIILKDTSRNKARGSFDGIGSDKLLWECDRPNIVARAVLDM